MRPFYLLISLLLVCVLSACGSEEELNPPGFNNISATGSLGSTTILTAPFQDPSITITGAIDDPAANIVANSTASGEQPVVVLSDGNWSFTFAPLEGVKIVSFTATDQRGNINQLLLTVTLDKTAPTVTSVTQDLTDTLNPKLIITFNETLNDGSMATASFDIDGTILTGAILDTVLKQIVILPLMSAALPAGSHRLTYSGMSDIATPDGNVVVAGSFVDF